LGGPTRSIKLQSGAIRVNEVRCTIWKPGMDVPWSLYLVYELLVLPY